MPVSFQRKDSQMIDLHCHILWGVDDGARDKTQALEMAQVAAADGLTGIVATPHDVEGLYSFKPQEIIKMVEDLKTGLAGEGIPLELYPGSEVALDLNLEVRYAAGELLTLAGKGRHILVELPAAEIPSYTDAMLYRLQVKGLTPVLAHPERNQGVLQKPHWLGEVVERGVLVQLSAPSITGLFGPQVQKRALDFVRRGWVHFVASDAHSAGRRRPSLTGARVLLEKMLSREAVEWIFEKNPRLVVEGKEVGKFAGDLWLKEKGLWCLLSKGKVKGFL